VLVGWLGHQKYTNIISKMTYAVSSGTLNLTELKSITFVIHQLATLPSVGAVS